MTPTMSNATFLSGVPSRGAHAQQLDRKRRDQLSVSKIKWAESESYSPTVCVFLRRKDFARRTQQQQLVFHVTKGLCPCVDSTVTNLFFTVACSHRLSQSSISSLSQSSISSSMSSSRSVRFNPRKKQLVSMHVTGSPTSLPLASRCPLDYIFQLNPREPKNAS